MVTLLAFGTLLMYNNEHLFLSFSRRAQARSDTAADQCGTGSVGCEPHMKQMQATAQRACADKVPPPDFARPYSIQRKVLDLECHVHVVHQRIPHPLALAQRLKGPVLIVRRVCGAIGLCLLGGNVCV